MPNYVLRILSQIRLPVAAGSFLVAGSPVTLTLDSGEFDPPDIASHDFTDGTLGPYTRADSANTTNVAVIDDPTGSGRGKVVRYLFTLPGGAGHVDHNLAIMPNHEISAGETVFFRGDVRVGIPQTEFTHRKLLYWIGGNNQFQVVVGLSHDADVDEYWLSKNAYDGGTVGNQITWGIFQLQLNTWYTIETEVKVNTGAGQVNGLLRIWIDGVEIYSDAIACINTGGGSLSSLKVGQQIDADTNNATSETRYWDRVAFSTTRIGP